MALINPRASGILSFVFIIVYYGIVIFTDGLGLNYESGFLILTLGLGILVFNTAYGFGAEELKSTAGVKSVFDLKASIQLALFLFSLFVALGFDALLVISTEISVDANSTEISQFLLFVTVGFLIFYPIIQFRMLASPGEDSSLPAEYYLELIIEGMAEKLRSTWIASILTYLVLYIIPIISLLIILQTQVITAVVLWALILPMINVGALSGTGLGEDLLRMRLIRKGRFFKDFLKLGFPKISFKDKKTGDFKLIPSVDVGGIFLVLLAIQALITTAYFSIDTFLDSFEVTEDTVNRTAFGLIIVAIVIVNKGRGALKELIGVWREGGFKVSALPLYLPVFVLLGVVLSSILELFVNLSPGQQEASVLGAYGVNDHPRLLAFFLILNNLIFIYSALIIYFRPPGSAERRLVREVPQFYENSDGWAYFYDRIKSDRAVVAMLEIAEKEARRDKSQLPLIKRMISETQDSQNDKVLTTGGKILMQITKRLESSDQEIYGLIVEVMESKSTGARIYAVRAARSYASLTDGDELLNLLTFIQTKLYDEDVSVKWEATQAIRKILKDMPKLRGYVLSMIIRSLSSQSLEVVDAPLQLLNRATRDSEEIGQMALSTLTIQLSSEQTENPNYDSIVAGIKQVIRARPLLGRELIEVLKQELTLSALHRRNSLKVISTLAEYVNGQEEIIQVMILDQLNYEDNEVRKEAYRALEKSIYRTKAKLRLSFTYISTEFDILEEDVLVLALKTLERIVETTDEFNREILSMLKSRFDSASDEMLTQIIELLGDLTQTSDSSLIDDIYLVLEDYITHNQLLVKTAVISSFGRVVEQKPENANPVYRHVSPLMSINDKGLQVALVETLGKIASHASRLAEEIFATIVPFTQDDDWQVRSLAYQSLVNTANRNSELRGSIMKYLPKAFEDSDSHVRLEALNYTSEFIQENPRVADEIFPFAKKLIKSKDPEIRGAGLRLMALLADRKATLVDDILSVIYKNYDEDEFNARNAVLEVLKNAMQKISKLRSLTPDVEKSISNNITGAMKAANHSDPRIRRTGYEALTIINSAIPLSEHADRGRNAIEKAQKRQERDPALLEFLEECRIRSLPPLTDEELDAL